MIDLFFLIVVIGVVFVVVLPFVFLGRKPKSMHPGITYEYLPPGYRRYTIFTPHEYTGEQSVPLILALHYTGHGIPFFGGEILLSLIKPAFGEINPIIISPDCPAKYWHDAESEQMIFDLLDEIQEKYNINPNQILVTGYSLGGMGTWHYAGRYPNHFTAAIVVAGNPPEDALEIDWRIPLLVIHGCDDEIFPLRETKEIYLQLKKLGFDIEFRILEGVSHYDIKYYGAALRNTIPWLTRVWEESRIKPN
jgi:predicted peptidase